MARITSQQIRQMMLIVDSSLDPNFPPEKLAVFDEQGNPLDLSDIALRLRLSVLSNWRGEWNENTAYDEGSLVRYNSSLYLATNNVAANGATPDAPGDTLWAFLAGGGAGGSGGSLYEVWKGAWAEDVAYTQGDLVTYIGSLYMANENLEPNSAVPNEPNSSAWIALTAPGMPPGGQAGQALVKFSETNFDAIWDLPAGSTDTNAMHFRGTWFNNAPYTWGDVVIDDGGLYILNSVDELPAFQPAPSSETDPDTANWMKIANVT